MALRGRTHYLQSTQRIGQVLALRMEVIRLSVFAFSAYLSNRYGDSLCIVSLARSCAGWKSFVFPSSLAPTSAIGTATPCIVSGSDLYPAFGSELAASGSLGSAVLIARSGVSLLGRGERWRLTARLTTSAQAAPRYEPRRPLAVSTTPHQRARIEEASVDRGLTSMQKRG